VEQFEVQGGHPDLWLADSFLFLLLVNSPNLPTFFSGGSEELLLLFGETWKLARNVPLVFCSVVIFRREFKSKMAVLASCWLKHVSRTTVCHGTRMARNVPFGECCYFWSTSNSKSKMATLVSGWLYYFGFVLQN